MFLTKTYSQERDAHLPRPVYALLALVCSAFGFWASVITLRYFEHGAQALEADEAAQALALAAALMFVAAEMAAFGIAAFLPVRKMWAQRWRLFGLAGAVLALEVCTIVAVQLAITEGAEMSQQATASRAQDLRNQIARIEANAATLRANAEKQTASTHAWVRQQGAMAAKEAARLDESTAALYAELGKTEGEKRPTLIGMLGERWALAYVVARGVLVSVAGLVFFGVAGAMWRAVFTGATVGMGRSQAKWAPWWGILKAKPAPQPVPEQAPQPAPASPPQPDTQTPQQTTPEPATPASKPAPSPAPAMPDKAPRKPAQRRTVQAGVKVDTGTGERDGHRFRRVRQAIKAGKLAPTIAAIQRAEGGSYPTVTGYLAELEREGLIQRTPDGKRWEVKAGA
ncbi:hypothetical protein VITFI_CDS2903 [Vitreoscilla filiformis]|uniref:Uncharacterized protein n=1 Tax=Vitreoscilla filiformis TaxID=63 RepID=A0A221KIQ2_VITFI|nr:hypothetical protein [Vitreoscilla filiformis]ASM78680.1 hypothetical protein VITFI_CDS2903 [Vitreoscilla filiformis]